MMLKSDSFFAYSVAGIKIVSMNNPGRVKSFYKSDKITGLN